MNTKVRKPNLDRSVELAYLSVLNRLPTESEKRSALHQVRNQSASSDPIRDLVVNLIASTGFRNDC